MEELAPFTVVAVANLWVMELLAQLGHVVGRNVLLLLKFVWTVSK
jgi:hypothetical protein